MCLAMSRQIRHYFQACNDSQTRQVSPFWKENREAGTSGAPFLQQGPPTEIMDPGHGRNHEVQISQLHVSKVPATHKSGSWVENFKGT